MESINVLLIEDDELDAQSVQRQLDRSGSERKHSVFRAKSLKEAFSILQTRVVDVALLDLSLPDSSGIATLEAFHAEYPNLPIVVLTGLKDERIALSALHQGAEDYLTKGEIEHSLSKSVQYALERFEIRRELEEAKQAAGIASVAKTNFLANMSHEMRTPLTAILGFTEIALDPDLAAQHRSALTVVHRNAEHLLQVIDNILDLSKVEAGKVVIENLDCSLFDVLARVEATLGLKATEKGITFQFEYEFPLPSMIRTDPTRLKQILFNIIGNGIKFTSVGGVRTVVSLNANHELQFATIDSGPGLTVDEKAKLFKAFSQADASTTRRFGGSGLGLIISRQLSELLGGTVECESEKGKGSVFTVTINPGLTESTLMVGAVPSSSLPVTAERPKSDLRMLTGRVLVVDDMPDNRELLTIMLTKLGLKIGLAEDGQTGLNRALSEDFDLVLLDMQMPVMDGYEMAKELRAAGYTMPIVALTASAIDGALDRCIEAGCDEYLRKPYRKAQLHAVLSRYLRRTDEGSLSPGEFDTIFDILSEDPELAPAILGFLDRLSERVADISGACESERWDELGQMAHRLAAGGLFGFVRLGKLASSLETLAATRNPSGVPQLIDALQSVVREIFAIRPRIESIAEELALTG